MTLYLRNTKGEMVPFCVPQKQECHIGLEQHESEQITEFSFLGERKYALQTKHWKREDMIYKSRRMMNTPHAIK